MLLKRGANTVTAASTVSGIVQRFDAAAAAGGSRQAAPHHCAKQLATADRSNGADGA